MTEPARRMDEADELEKRIFPVLRQVLAHPPRELDAVILALARERLYAKGNGSKLSE